ncbi:MAG: hypothetical protein LBR88_08700 [Zoogloeaceae bacterium]|jgi:hypothetical protein|nr:hypothetical protein [Zoogloeaceae bacterium]
MDNHNRHLAALEALCNTISNSSHRVREFIPAAFEIKPPSPEGGIAEHASSVIDQLGTHYLSSAASLLQASLSIPDGTGHPPPQEQEQTIDSTDYQRVDE